MITADKTVEASVKQVSFGRTVINWNKQLLHFPITNDGTHTHELTEGQWNYLVNGLETLMSNIPGVSNLVVPDYDPDMFDDDE